MSALFKTSIASSIKSYDVTVGVGVAEKLLSEQEVILIVDQKVNGLYPWLQGRNAIVIEAKEENKTLATVATTIEQLRALGANRHTHVVAVGGGIIQDLSTFAASSYMRGVKWTYFATTLLGMADSCIGGKSSINVGPYKNIAGNFYPPELVLVDTEFCNTLSDEQKIEGLLEAVKICFASDGAAFDRYLAIANSGDLLKDNKLIAEVIALSLATKKKFIEEDEFDNGIRLLLNFGHTFGHAIEGASNYRISHGVAVGLGMLAAMDFSQGMGWSQETNSRIRSLKTYVCSLLSMVDGLASSLSGLSSSDALEKFRSDKKHRKQEFAVIAFDEAGFLVRRFVPVCQEVEGLIIDAFENLKRSYEIQ
jgi:3-dehydroquinate synthase